MNYLIIFIIVISSVIVGLSGDSLNCQNLRLDELISKAICLANGDVP
jgi:hypothetical protein